MAAPIVGGNPPQVPHHSRGLTRILVILAVVGILLLGTAADVALQHDSTLPGSPTTPARMSDARTAQPSPEPIPPSLQLPAAGSSIGAVLSTLDLSSNQLYTGPEVVAVQTNFGAEYPVYDVANGNIYVRGNSAGDISVVNASTFTNIANIPAPIDDQATISIPSIAVDNQTGYVYATDAQSGNISVIDPTTELITHVISVGSGPKGIAFDWKNGDLYVADFASANVAVVPAALNSVTTFIPVGTDPTTVAFDSVSDRVFVTNYGSGNVTVIDPSTNLVTASVNVGTDPMALALDTVDGDVDVLNAAGASSSVSTFSATSPPSSATPVSVASYAESFAYDSASDRLFVVGGEGSLTVLQQPGNTVQATLTIGTESEVDAAAFDARDGYVFVSGFDGGPSGAGNITVFNGANDRVVANDTTNDLPLGVTVDPGTGIAYVVNYGTSLLEPNVTALSESAGLPVASIPLWAAPTGLAYDSAQGEVYAVDNAGNDIYAVSTSTGRVTNVETGGPTPTSTSVPDPIVYDGANGDIYATAESQAAVDVFGPSHTLLSTISVGEEPDALAYDNVSDLLFVGDAYTGKVAVIDTSTNTVLAATLSVTPYNTLSAVAYDPHNNEVYVADQTGGNVTVWGAENDTEVHSIPVGSTPRSIAVDPENNTIFVANQGSGNISVINDSTNRVVHSISPVGAYLLAYDAASNSVYNAFYFANELEAYNASTYAPLSGSPLELGEGGGYYVQGLVYDPANGAMYVDDSTGDAFNEIGPESTPSYPVEFVEYGLPQGTSWSVTLNGVEQSSLGTTIEFADEYGSLPFTVGTVPDYTANVTAGTVDVTDSGVTVHIGFAPNHHEVSFVETGLPPGSIWNVTLNEVENDSATDTIGFSEIAGTYSFTVGPFIGYAANVTHGSVTVSSSAVMVEIGFLPVSSVFPVTFVENGLPGTTLWSVTFNGATNSSTTSSIGFLDPNGTWSFSVGTVTGYSANPPSGSVQVQGKAVGATITFTAVSAPISVRLAIDPSTVKVGGTATIQSIVSGGVAPDSYRYSGLPSGCSTENLSSWNCQPGAEGNYTIIVVVTDAQGHAASASAMLNVSAAPSGGSGASSSLTTVELAAGVGAVIAAALVIFALVGRRRRRPPETTTTATPPVAPPS